MQQRLAESFEAALRLAEGRALALEMDSGTEHLFSAPSSRLPGVQLLHQRAGAAAVLVQLPVGACPTCDGLGQHGVLRPGPGGGLPDAQPGQRRHQGLGPAQRLLLRADLEAWPSTTKFSVEAPFESLPAPVQHGVLHGSGEEDIKFSYTWTRALRGKKLTKSTRSKASSPTWRGATARPIRWRCAKTWRATAACSPARLRRHPPAARGPPREDWRRRRPAPSFEVSHATLRDALDYFTTLKMHRRQGRIADKVVREIGHRLKFLNDVGLNYLSLDRSAETLSGGEAQRIRLASQIGSGLTGVMYVLDGPASACTSATTTA